VIYAIYLQREELQLQRLELAETRRELAKSAAAQEESQKALNKTIYAQSFKIALDIIESNGAINSRGFLHAYRRTPADQWGEGHRQHAEAVSRSFETVGTMIRQETLPADYIVNTWSVPISRNWIILKPYILSLRHDRDDPYVGQDFEMLAGLAESFLDAERQKRGSDEKSV